MERAGNRVIAVVGDLFFKSKIAQTAGILGVPIVFATTEASLREALSDGGVSLVVVDLGVRSIEPAAAIAIARAASGVRSVAFASHVDEEAQRRAREAGCDQVMAKSAFTRDLALILESGVAG